MKLFKVLGLFYFFLIMVIGAMLFKKSYCISSKLVKSINIQRSEGQLEMPGCWQNQYALNTPILGEKKTLELIDSVSQEFEEFLYQNKWAYYEPYEWLIGKNKVEGPRSISIESAQAQKSLNLRKKLVLKWLQDLRKNEKQTSSLLADEILSDVLVYIIWNEKIADLSDKHYSELVFSQKTLCQSAWAPTGFSPICEKLLQNPNSEAFNKLSEWSLRPLFLKIFIEKYDSMTIAQKVKFESGLYLKLVQFQVPKKFDLKLDNINIMLTQFSESFWGEKTSDIGPIFNEIWLFYDSEINEKSLFCTGKYYLNPYTRSYFEFENFYVKKIHLGRNIGLRDLKNLNAEYAYIRKSQKIHIPSLKLAQQLEPRIFELDNTLTSIQKTIGWNPVLATDVDRGI